MHWHRLGRVLKKGISPCNYPASTLKGIFVRNFYYLLTQLFETKETTIFSLLHTLALSFLLSFAVSVLDFFADISMGVHPRNKIPYIVFKALSVLSLVLMKQSKLRTT